ncbi:MAG: PQQ-binding-like beta-propeller repeat protein [Bryobacteraceae bacterium]
MTTPPSDSTPRKPLRLWPGVLAVTLMWLIRFGVPVLFPDALMYSIIAVPAGALAILVWWVFFSRALWIDRLGVIALMIVTLAATPRILHPSIATGMMGIMFFIFALPGLCLAFVVSVAVGRNLSDGPRRATMAAAILLACGAWAFLRTGGINSSAASDFAWRWAPTPEDRLLAHANDKPPVIPPAPAAATPEPAPVAARISPAPAAAEPSVAPLKTIANTAADWPGFRGSHRDDIVPGVRIQADWSAAPPAQMWRRPIGPGWSSFAVHGGLLYTQEQRGSDEIVACYNLTTGEPVWRHSDAARFWESNAGPGPRATPTLSNGRVYTFGATGILNALDARNGAVIWSRNAASDTGVQTPGWGFASSPLVVDGVVVVAAAGKLAAYDIATGKPRWFGADGGDGYSSPHLVTIDGVPQILLVSGSVITSVAPDSGTRLWDHPLPPSSPIVQPALTADGDILVSEGESHGMHRLAIAHGAGGWTVEERWKSIGLKPYFNDFVIHNGYAFGFDGSILSCIDLKDGKRVWKGGRYGSGQFLLLSEQDLLLVLSEEGELALVAATPGQFKELAKFPAIEGKTWNHPVLAGDILLVRNGQEMAAFRLSLARL